MFVLTDEVRTARKFYACDASELWRNYGPPSDAVNADDRLVLEGVKADKWKIRPGQRYRCVVFRDGRELVTPRDGCTRRRTSATTPSAKAATTTTKMSGRSSRRRPWRMGPNVGGEA